MNLVKSKCPNCGEISDIEANEFNVVCRFCGVPYMPKEGIDKYNKHISNLVDSLSVDTVNVNAENIANYAMLGIASLKDGNHEKCGFYAEDILKRNPQSPEGLLLKAYFVSDNYSKEEGIRNYLISLKFAKESELIELILSTWKKDISNYSLPNYEYLFESLFNKKGKIYQDLFSYGLMSYFINNNNSDLNNVFLDAERVFSFYDSEKKKISSFDNKEIYLLNEDLFFIDNGKIFNVCCLSEIRSEVEKYLNKKDGNSVTYYFYLDDEKIVNISFQNENLQLEELLIDKKFNINTIKGGCYIASCVYGSYNAKEVWVLRRYRDSFLSTNLFGRFFIKIYYKVSPILLKFFSNKKWFVKINKKWLDSFTNYLIKKGYSSKPYKD